MVSYRSWDIDLLYDISDAWTFQVNFMYEKFLYENIFNWNDNIV